MMDKKTNETGIKIAKWALLAAAVYLGMKYIFPIVLPFLAALVLARLLYPPASFLEKKTGMKKEIARFLAYGIFLAGMGMAAALFVWLCCRMGSRLMAHLEEWSEGILAAFGRCCVQLEQSAGISAEGLRRAVKEGIGGFAKDALAGSTDAGLNVLGIFAGVLVTCVAAFLMLADYEKMMDALGGTQAGRRIREMLREAKGMAGAYLGAQLCIMGTVTAVCVAGLFLMRIPYALWFGIAIGLFDALPFFGTGSIFVPWTLACLLTGAYRTAAGCFGLYLLCSFIREFLEPKLVGKSLGIPPLFVLASIYIGIRVYGGMGILTGPLSALVLYEIRHLREGD